MEDIITKETLRHLSELSKIDFNKAKEEKLLQDLRRILDYFNELNDVSTDNTEPAVGGSFNKNVLRADELRDIFVEENIRNQFPETHDALLCVPQVFEKNEDI